MDNHKCLIIDEMFPNIINLLEEIGVEPTYKPTITRDQIIEEIGSYYGLIVRSKTRIDRQLLAGANNLKYIARAGAGIDNIDQEACQELGITIFNAPEANRDIVGEHTLGMLLCLYNKINLADQEVRQGKWDREGNRGTEIQGKTIGIIGYGNMGSAFAKRLKGFDCKVIAYDKYRSNYGDKYANEVSIEALMNDSDVLSLHVPLTDETNGMVNIDFLRGFRKNITLINVARGKVVVLNDLIKALDEGKVISAALDVLENEKIDQLEAEEQRVLDNLNKRENVLFTPHVAGWSFESYEKINKILAHKIAGFLKGQ